MMISSLLAESTFTLLEQGYQIGLDWLGQFARVIIEGVGNIGLGIILFTLILKAITLPFDIYQRVKMRKNNLVMAEMKDDLEKLQKQYADDQNMYNTKMQELYKKNGISMFSACLPSLLSLAILIVAFQGFNAYSQFANLSTFIGMSEAYNEAILEYGVEGVDVALLKDEEGIPVVEDGKYTFVWQEGGEQKTLSAAWEVGATLGIEKASETGAVYTMSEKDGNKYMRVSKEGQCISYEYNLDAAKLEKNYVIDCDLLLEDEDAAAGVEEIMAAQEEAGTPVSRETACRLYITDIGALAARDWYRTEENAPGFLWVKNVWYPDVSYAHPIPTDLGGLLGSTVTLESGEKVRLSTIITDAQYASLTSRLTEEKAEPNGYFVLIVLSIGLMLLSQFITMRSQKDTSRYQTVDGAGASSQKMMLVLLPLIYGVFAFMYSAAFSIYMTMSSLIALLVTLLSNFIIGRVFKKKEEEKIKEKYGRTLSWKDPEGKKRRK